MRAWIDEAPVLDSTERPLTAGDILILVRSRGELASLIVARLFAAGVPVAGIDRLHLHKPFAVQDLLAAVTFAVQPLDDLNLANLLVSPLIGWDQQQLLDLAHGRKGRLWRALRERAGEREISRRRTRRSADLLAWRITRLRRASWRRSSPVRSMAAASFTAASASRRAIRSTSW